MMHRTFLRCLFALSLCAQVALAQDAPMRLALLYPPEAAPLGDLLTSELSKQQGVTLLEREQIRRIFEEKSLNAAQAKQDWAKIGELLGAEGLVILEPAENKSVSLRLVWAERGIIVHETAIDIDEKDPKKAVASALPQIEKAVRKLVDLRHAGKSAVAMHIKAVNADSGKDPDLRQGLGLLFAQRMLDEPGWVVVDRRNLTDAVFEKDLAQDKGDQKLVAATHRLTLGFAKDGDLLKIRGEVEMPTGQPKKFEFAGKFNEPAALAKSFMSELRKAMGMDEGGTAQAWDPIQEANAHFEWAHDHWRGSMEHAREVYEATSSAWALGLHEPKVSQLRAIALCAMVWPDSQPGLGYEFHDLPKDKEAAVKNMLAALDLARSARSEPLYYEEFLYIPLGAERLLRAIYDDGVEDQLAKELGVAIREAVDAMPCVQWKLGGDMLYSHAAYYKEELPRILKRIYVESIIRYSSLWENDYAAAQQRIEKILFDGDLDATVQNEGTKDVPFWRYLEKVCLTGYSACWRNRPQSHLLFSRQPRYKWTFFFEPKKPADEAECYRRAAEIMRKLASDSNSHRKLFANVIQDELKKRTGQDFPLAGRDVWDPAIYLVDRNTLDFYDEHTSKTINYSSPPHEIAELILRVLGERRQNQFVSSGFLARFLQFNYSEDDVARLFWEIDKYLNQIRAEWLKEGVPTKKQTDYLVAVAGAMESLLANNSAALRTIRKTYPDASVPQDAFPVTHYQFSTNDRLPGTYTCYSMDTRPPTYDEKHIYAFEINRENTSRVLGITAVQPPDGKPKRMWSAGSVAPSAGSLMGSHTSNGRLFFTDRDGDQWTIRCLKIEGGETAVSVPGLGGRSPDIIGCLPPFLYYKYLVEKGGDSDRRVNGTADIFERWNIETNKTEVLADSRRKPATNPLEEEGVFITGLARLPDGDDGVLASCSPKSNLYKIAKTGDISLFRSWDREHPPKEEWLLEGIKESFARDNPRYVHETQKQMEELLIDDHLGFCRLFASAPFSPENYALVKPVFPQVVSRSPVAFCSFSPFEMGGIRAAISIGREMGTPSRSRTDLVFFEPDGIKSVPLRFEMKPGDLDRLRQYLRDERNWGDAANDFTPNPRVLAHKNPGVQASDTACVANETLCITNNNAELLWFLTKEEILEARKRAKPIETSNISLSLAQ